MIDNSIPNIEDFYIFGVPVETDIGKVDFLRVKDYAVYYLDLQLISMSKLEIIYKYTEANKDGQLDELIKQLEKMDLYAIVASIEELHQAYVNVFLKVFENEEMVGKVNKDNFENYRHLIMRMNCVQEEEISPNPEIQRAIERSKRVKAQDKENITFAAMCSSIVAFSGIDYRDLLDWTIYQFYMTYQRIDQIKNYDAMSSIAPFAEVNIEHWGKHIDLFKKEKHFMTEKEFNSTIGKAVSD